MALIFIVLLINLILCTGLQRVCDESYECANGVIDCPNNEICDIICSAMSNACINTEINCPTNDLCKVQCGGSRSCQNITMNCEYGECIVDCEGPGACKYATINGGNTSNFLMRCKNEFACDEAKIFCPDSNDCHIECNGAQTRSCTNTIIHGAVDKQLTIDCQYNEGCEGIIVNATQSSYVELLNCATGNNTCRGITVLCPPNINGTKKCILNGDAGLNGMDPSYPITFYAINGFQDIDFSATCCLSDSDYDGIMYCRSDYSVSCNISEGWICDPNGDITCNDPPVFESPTIHPTFSPITPIPTTISPSELPSTNPSYTPTVTPSTNTTIVNVTTTDNLTTNPSKQPSINVVGDNESKSGNLMTYIVTSAVVGVGCILGGVLIIFATKYKRQLAKNQTSVVELVVQKDKCNVAQNKSKNGMIEQENDDDDVEEMYMNNKNMDILTTKTMNISKKGDDGSIEEMYTKRETNDYTSTSNASLTIANNAEGHINKMRNGMYIKEGDSDSDDDKHMNTITTSKREIASDQQMNIKKNNNELCSELPQTIEGANNNANFSGTTSQGDDV